MLEIAEKWRTMAAFEEKFARYGGPGMAALPAVVERKTVLASEVVRLLSSNALKDFAPVGRLTRLEAPPRGVAALPLSRSIRLKMMTSANGPPSDGGGEISW